MFTKVACKLVGVFGANNNNVGVAIFKFVMVSAQLRHMRLAIWSEEAAIENEQDVMILVKLR